MRRKIGFTRLGVVGKWMFKNPIRAGHELAGYDVVEAPLRELEKLGAKPASSAKP